MTSNQAIAVAFCIATTMIWFVSLLPAYPHDAPTGWAYPYSCCSGIDCREVKDSSIGENSTDYIIKQTGEQIPMSDARIKDSPDGNFHWCSTQGREDGKTICLFVPPRGM